MGTVIALQHEVAGFSELSENLQGVAYMLFVFQLDKLAASGNIMESGHGKFKHSVVGDLFKAEFSVIGEREGMQQRYNPAALRRHGKDVVEEESDAAVSSVIRLSGQAAGCHGADIVAAVD